MTNFDKTASGRFPARSTSQTATSPENWASSLTNAIGRSSVNPSSQPSSPEEEQLYQHLLEQVQTESPSRLIERFRSLFIDGVGYPNRGIVEALDKIAAASQAPSQFPLILNRCCHILINRWQMQQQLQSAIPDLIEIFETPSTISANVRTVRNRSIRRLQELVQHFTRSEYYLALKRLARVIGQAQEQDGPDSKPLGTLIRRYPYLYKHCLMGEDSSYEHQQVVSQIQAERQRQFELDLSQYVTYQVRRVQMRRGGASPQTMARILPPQQNPTLLTDRELYSSLKQFVGKVEGQYTYRDVAQRFLTHTSQTRTFGVFKDDLYEYVTSSIDSGYGRRQFNNRLYERIQNTLPQSNSQKLSDFLVVRTCSQLMNFLVVEGSQRPNHFVFIDLLTNIGAPATTGVLLKIVLVCRKVRPYLERRFSLLFDHYESCTRNTVGWLVTSLENLNLALSIHFGSMDLSCLNQIF